MLRCWRGHPRGGGKFGNLYNTYEYSKETVRGRATDISSPDAPEKTGGMDRNAITAWSYGIDETWTLLIPNVKGGATIKPEGAQNKLMSVADTDKASDFYLEAGEQQFLQQWPQYFGDQPMTNGPVYVGAFVLLLCGHGLVCGARAYEMGIVGGQSAFSHAFMGT